MACWDVVKWNAWLFTQRVAAKQVEAEILESRSHGSVGGIAVVGKPQHFSNMDRGVANGCDWSAPWFRIATVLLWGRFG